MDATTKRGALGLVLIVAGLLAVVLGWVELRHSDITAEQICFATSGGLGGLVALLIGSALVLSSNSAMESRRLEAVLGNVDPGTPTPQEREACEDDVQPR